MRKIAQGTAQEPKRHTVRSGSGAVRARGEDRTDRLFPEKESRQPERRRGCEAGK